MPLEDVLQTESYDALCYGFGSRTVEDAFAHKSIEEDPLYDKIRNVMEEEQINAVPVVIIGDVFYEGHHRVMIARELDLPVMLVTDDWAEYARFEIDEVYRSETRVLRLHDRAHEVQRGRDALSCQLRALRHSV